MFMRCGIQNLFLVRHYKQYFSFLCCRNGRFHLGLYFKVCFIIIYIRLIPCRYVTLNVPCKIIVSFYFKGLCCHVFQWRKFIVSYNVYANLKNLSYKYIIEINIGHGTKYMEARNFIILEMYVEGMYLEIKLPSVQWTDQSL